MQISEALGPAERLIEIGWLISDDLDTAEYRIIEQARQKMLAQLQAQFSQFDWRMPMVRWLTPQQADRSHSSSMLYEAAYERDNRFWDYVLIITARDLQSYYKPYALAMPSRALAVGLISTVRLATKLPATNNGHEPELAEIKAQRLCTLGLHLLADLNGLEHSNEPASFLFEPQVTEDLDRMESYVQDEQERLAQAFAQVADLRLEEQPQRRTLGILGFYLKAIWHLRGEISSAVKQAKPWEFPFHLSRLSTAAMSALLILIITAEAWDLGMSQDLLDMCLLSILALFGTSIFIVKRQRLLLRYSRRRLSEQIVVTNVAISTVVILGMAVTYLMLFTVTLILANSLFGHNLVTSWAASLNGEIAWLNYLTLGQLTAALGLIIGALGASFEGQEYFRHIAYVDEEL